MALALTATFSPAAAAAPGAVLDRVLTDTRIGESSGLAVSRRHEGVLWTHNDSGDAARLYAIGPDGSTLATVTLAGVQARDWEAMASSVAADGTPLLWVGDIGDNLGARINGLRVHRIEEPVGLTDVEVEPTSYELRYPGSPGDAESLLVDPRDGRLVVVTKTPVGGVVYGAPLALDSAEPNLLEPLGKAPDFLTDGAYAPDGRMLVRGYGGLWAGDPQRGWTGPVGLPPAEQGESLAVSVDGAFMYVGSEGARSEIWRVPLPAVPTRHATTAPAAAPDWGRADRNVGALDGSPWAIPIVVGSVAFLLALALVVTRRSRRWLTSVLCPHRIGDSLGTALAGIIALQCLRQREALVTNASSFHGLTADESWVQASEWSSKLSWSDQASRLLQVIGPRFTAAGVGVRDAETVRRWRDEKDKPSDQEQQRLRLLFRIVEAISGVYGSGSVAAGFLRSANPQLDDQAPIVLLGTGDPDKIQQELLAATRAFLEG